MDTDSPKPSVPVTSSPSDVLTAAPSPKGAIVTRRQLPRTRLSEKHGIVAIDDQPGSGAQRKSIVTRRKEQLRRRKRKRILTALAIVLAMFPPLWPIYLITWLIWRSKPAQKSMREVRKAIRSLEKNQTGVALKQLQDAHLLDPSNNDALYWLGLLLSQQQRQEEAAEALSLVAERIPGLPEVEAALVEAHIAMEESDGAIYHAQRLVDVAPDAPETLMKLADAFEAAGRIELAIQALEQAPLHKRTLTDALLQIHYRLGALYERQGDDAQALHHFKRVYARDISFKDVRTRVQALEAKNAE